VAGLSGDERTRLLELARRTLRDVVLTGQLPSEGELGPWPERLRAERGSFVTLTRNQALRGCIGNVLPDGPLWRSVMRNAQAAALRDYRFPPVQAAELDDLAIEISVLSATRTLAFASPEELLAKLRPDVDGVVLRIGAGLATFLPQVWERMPDKVRFLDSLARKAGGAPGDWRKPDASVLTYEVECFSEPAPAA
jgi:AmmeMemoRadiSam system protein A